MSNISRQYICDILTIERGHTILTLFAASPDGLVRQEAHGGKEGFRLWRFGYDR